MTDRGIELAKNKLE